MVEKVAAILGSSGGKARAAKLTPEQRSHIAKIAAEARWTKYTNSIDHIGMYLKVPSYIYKTIKEKALRDNVTISKLVNEKLAEIK